MKFRYLALCAALLAASMHAHAATQEEIQADLVHLQIIAALKAEDYAGAVELFEQYDTLGVVIPPPLQLQRAVAYSRLQRYVEAKNQLQAYLLNAERGSDDYRQALSMLAEVIPLAEAAEAEAARKVAAAEAEAARKAAAAEAEAARKAAAELAEITAQTPLCKGKGGDYEGDSLLEAVEQNNCLSAALLIKKGADVNAKTDDGRTPLHRAAENNAAETAAVLIQHGADVNAKTDDGRTPLYLAAGNNVAEVVALLIQHGADVNVKTNHGRTPLHWAAWHDAAAAATVLIQLGADVNAKDEYGVTPLRWAAGKNAAEAAALLIQHGAKKTGLSRKERKDLKRLLRGE